MHAVVGPASDDDEIIGISAIAVAEARLRSEEPTASALIGEWV